MNLKTVFLLFIFLSIVFVGGCAQLGAESVCGNGVIEAGEECDGIGCPADKICTEKCKCETMTPPPLPD